MKFIIAFMMLMISSSFGDQYLKPIPQSSLDKILTKCVSEDDLEKVSLSIEAFAGTRVINRVEIIKKDNVEGYVCVDLSPLLDSQTIGRVYSIKLKGVKISDGNATNSSNKKLEELAIVDSQVASWSGLKGLRVERLIVHDTASNIANAADDIDAEAVQYTGSNDSGVSIADVKQSLQK
ncbi:MAG: hypothetical protein R3242_05710 [Akkermansiaceae bacterium]|nr:hypothetical protein [Akkermansiaceae bacterium]